MRLFHLPPALLAALSACPAFAQLTLDPTSPDSISSNMKDIATNMVNTYEGFVNTPGVGVPGELPQPYYWWEAGAMFGTLMDYWYYTGDEYVFTEHSEVEDTLTYTRTCDANHLLSEQSVEQPRDNWHAISDRT